MPGKSQKEVNDIMEAIPERWRTRWCGGELGACACVGCVQIGNRRVMAEKQLGVPYRGDPEYIDESKIDPEIYAKYKVNRDEWLAWMEENNDAR